MLRKQLEEQLGVKLADKKQLIRQEVGPAAVARHKGCRLQACRLHTAMLCKDTTTKLGCNPYPALQVMAFLAKQQQEQDGEQDDGEEGEADEQEEEEEEEEEEEQEEK
jgi:hypothetical protein